MAKRSSAADMHERILKSALVVFSDKGYSAATMKDISKKAGCNSVTIFRHFDDKLGLFTEVVKRFCKIEFCGEELNSKLSYINLHYDFSLMASHFFRLIYENIHIMRIFINDGHNYEPISKYLWFLPEEMKNFVEDYLHAMYLDKIAASEAAMITEMFLCYIIRTCLRINVHDGIEENSRQIEKAAREIMAVSVDMVTDLILIQVK